MKQLLIFFGIATISILSIVFQIDFIHVETAEKVIKTKLEDSASGAIFSIDEESYAEGYIIFNDEEVVNYVENTVPEDYNTVITIFDETMRQYQEGILTGTAIAITYPYTHTDQKGFTSVIHGPSIKLMALKEEEDMYRLPLLEKTEIVRSAMYSWEERKE